MNKLNKRATKIGEEIVKRTYANGGHWLELSMKTRDKLYIQRGNFESFEHLKREKFNVKQNGEWILSKVNLEDLAKYIDETF